LCQVISVVKTTMATVSGSQPPCSILVRLAAKNASSTVSNAAPPSATARAGLRHSSRATARNRMVVSTKVPVTATP
jgi:hypothetical protein